MTAAPTHAPVLHDAVTDALYGHGDPKMVAAHVATHVALHALVTLFNALRRSA